VRENARQTCTGEAQMSIEIFWGSGSGPAWRVLLTLGVKGLPFESHLLTFSTGEHRTPEMLAMNRRGKVPVLRNGDFVIYESLAVMTYLDRLHPSPPLFGRSSESAANIMRVIMEHECYGNDAMLAIARPIFRGEFVEKRQEIVDALPRLREELGWLEAELASHEWLGGTELSAADIFVLPALKSLERAWAKPGVDMLDHAVWPLALPFPKLGAWVKRMEGLPSYEAAVPPHWRTQA
jgi:glutathione S-transferase